MKRRTESKNGFNAIYIKIVNHFITTVVYVTKYHIQVAMAPSVFDWFTMDCSESARMSPVWRSCVKLALITLRHRRNVCSLYTDRDVFDKSNGSETNK